MVDRAGFEPASSWMQARHSYQAELPAHPHVMSNNVELNFFAKKRMVRAGAGI